MLDEVDEDGVGFLSLDVRNTQTRPSELAH